MNNYTVEESKVYWNKKAEENALFYTWSNKVSEEDYFKSGEDWVKKRVLKCLPKNRGMCLDIGCGCGRIAFVLADYFDRVIGIDISKGMIERATAYKIKFDKKNVDFIEKNSIDKNLKVDFVHTLTVFQHMKLEDWLVYVKDAYAILNKEGRFHIHFYPEKEQSFYSSYFENIGYKILNIESEGDCVIFLLEK